MPTDKCSTPSPMPRATSARSVPARWPSSCTTAPATASRWRWRRSSPWGSRPGSSRSPCGKPCAPAPADVSAPSIASTTGSCRNKYDPPSFALKLAHKDMRLATELGRELGAPMRLANMAFAEMTEALNRGWENRDSRSPMLLQLERCGLRVEVDSQAHPGGARPRSALQWRSQLRVFIRRKVPFK